jgi:hypothetical protein
MDDIRAGWSVEALIESRLLNLAPRAGRGRRIAPGEGDSPRVEPMKSPPHPDPLPAQSGAREKAQLPPRGYRCIIDRSRRLNHESPLLPLQVYLSLLPGSFLRPAGNREEINAAFSPRGNAPSDQLALDGRLLGMAAPTLDTQGEER